MAQKIGDMEQEGEEHKWVSLIIYYCIPGAGMVVWLRSGHTAPGFALPQNLTGTNDIFLF